MDIYSKISLYLVMLLQILDYHALLCREEMWDGIAVRFGTYLKIPVTSREAIDEGYERQNDICKTKYYHGFLYRYQSDTKLIPIYDLDGRLAGIQAIIPGNMKGFNSKNESISVPPVDVMPPILPRATKAGNPYYTITAYFKHPQLVCNPIAKNNVQVGKGLYIQTGDDPIRYHQQIPMKASDLDPIWKRADCLPSMGTHYFYNITKNLECEKIHPVFLMYDNEGHLGAFGWTFQGEPLDGDISTVKWFKLTKDTFFFAFDPKQLPSCMFTEGFQIFGLHIWLQPYDKDTMQNCPKKLAPTTKSSLPFPKTSTIRYSERVTEGPRKSNIIKADPNNSAMKLQCPVVLFSLVFVISRTLFYFINHPCHV